MNQKKPKRKNKKSTPLSKRKLINIFLLIFLFAFLATALSYFIMTNENPNKTIIKNDILEKKKNIPKKNQNEIEEFQNKKLSEYFDKEISNTDKFEEYTDELHKDIDEHEVIKEVKKEKVVPKKEVLEEKPQNEEEVIIEKKPVEIKTKPIIEEKIISKKDTYVYDKKSRPKLAILIDDVSTKRQKEKILNIGYKVNMAFLPPTVRHPSSAKIAQDLPFHMIHFPLQASPAFKGAEKFTLNINDSYEKIEQRVKQLRQWYPNVTYTNNHTGSVFTENEQAVDKLFKALKKYNFIFVDSRTSSKSVVKKYAKKYDMPYIVRNTFIDNERDYNKIKEQLIKAINIAKKKGFAIAIGHPHDITLQVLKESKYLLKDVDTIFIKELPYL